MKGLLIAGIIVIMLLIGGCQPAGTPVPSEAPVQNSPPPVQNTNTVEPSPTQPPPTATPEPTETSVPTQALTDPVIPTTTPEYMIFRDDFEGSIRPEWTWENEKPERWSITPDGWLQIAGEDTGLLYGQQQSNLLWTDLPDSAYAITVHLKAAPIANFAQAAIYLYENPENDVAINRGFCGPCSTGGNGIYMEYKINGQGGAYMVPFSETDLYLMLEDKDHVISRYYATSPEQWERLGRFGDYFKFKRVGLGVTNADQNGAHAEDLVGSFDFFEIRKP